MENIAPLVSICCITYNHENYIKDALEGFLMQKTNFNFEIIIGEDCSTDRTKSILEDYQNRFPSMINIISDEMNVGGIKNQIRTFESAKGKYIAMCDGDDYWTDPLKLQKQVDFMHNISDCAICCHYSRVIDDNGELVYEHEAPITLEFTYEDVLIGRKEETRICTLMMENNAQIREISQQDWYYKTSGADTFLKLFALENRNKKIYVLPEVMAVYRLHKDGVWSLIDSKVRKRKMIKDFNILINNFNYSTYYKKELLKMYISEFLLFDIRYFNISKALHTLKVLL